MNHHDRWTPRLSEYLDDGLPAGDREACEAHLAECAACREVLADLRRIVTAADGLRERQPPRDLWPGIASAIRSGSRDPVVLSFPKVEPEPPSAPRGAYLSWLQMAGAAAAVVLISVSATLAAGTGSGAQIVPVATGAVTAVNHPLEGEDTELAREVAALEGALDAARSRLDPNTVRLIEKNLTVIERAIAESRSALALDPENDYLRHHLDRAMERKRAVLEEATNMAEWTS